MRKCALVLSLAAIAAAASAKDIALNTPNTTLLLQAEPGARVYVRYYGSRLDDMSQVRNANIRGEEAYPCFGYGSGFISSMALGVTHSDGDLGTDLRYVSDSCTGFEGGTDYVVTTRDTKHNFEVDLCYRTYGNCDVIEMWTVIRNGEKKPVVLEKYASAALPFRKGDVWVSHEHGTWASEAWLTEEPLNAGRLEIADLSGTRNAMLNRPNIMLSLDGKPRENAGRTVGAVLCWSGNYRMTIDTDSGRYHHLVCGINETGSRYTLGRNECFTTPALAVVYSDEGKGGVSRNYHRWARLNGKIHNGQALRKTLLNSWEGVYLNVSQAAMEKMMDGVQALGAELFVMDDGWFGGKYKRSIDNCALGDWVTDTDKLPDGVPALEKAAAARGLKWGIWIEPEMTNTLSELYEKHPDWVICNPGREPVCGRGGTQLVLDMSNPAVQDYVFSIVDNIMKETPGTYYIKWDCNMDINSVGSSYLTSDRQSHLYVDYHLGLVRTLERIRAKYPDLVIQDCASGGGRVNYGLMPYFDEFWTSDNTDAEQRLFIQWGTSMFFPPCAMAQHVSASPNHQTGRVLPLKFRFDVAMTGRLGMEMKPSDLSPEEFEFARNAFATYKEIRPVVQQGDLYRILSPYDSHGLASEIFVTEDKSEAVFFVYKFRQYANSPAWPCFRFDGLDPDAQYVLTELNRTSGPEPWEGKTFSGRFLMDTGIELSLGGVYSSCIIRCSSCR